MKGKALGVATKGWYDNFDNIKWVDNQNERKENPLSLAPTLSKAETYMRPKPNPYESMSGIRALTHGMI